MVTQATPVITVGQGGLPIVIASTGGLPVSEALLGMPVTIASNGFGVPVTYVGTAPTAGPPINTVPPAVTGTTAVGQTLTSSTGTWLGAPTITYTYQWYRIDPASETGFKLLLANETDYLLLANTLDKLLLANQLVRVNALDVIIPGATSSTYVIPPGSSGSFFYCKVTATNSLGSATANSNVRGPVA